MNKTYSKTDNFEKIKLLKIGFNDINYSQVLEYSLENIKNFSRNLFFVTPNPELLVIAQKQNSFADVLNSADLALPDGIGIILGSRIAGRPIKHRNPGADLMENLCRDVSNRPITVGFLGGGPGVADKTADCLTKKYPDLKVGLTYSGRPDRETLQLIKKKVDGKKLDILFVAFGSPRQEIWIAENLKALPAKITIGVGGAFDFISGKIPRAPKFLRQLGLEWLFRLILQPWRIRRQLSLINFIFLVLKEKFSTSSV